MILAADTAAVGGLAAGLGLLAVSEAGVPVPLPTDVIALVLGERAAAGTLPPWVAFLLVEMVALVSTAALFLFCRGPGFAVVHRLGPKVGLTKARLDKVTGLAERRGRGALALGRATPGLRTLTVVAAGTSGVHARKALPALVIGSTVFLQFHVAIGLLLGATARHAIDRAKGPFVIAAVALVVAAAMVWLVRRGRREGVRSWTEAACPACVVAGIVGARLDAPATVSPGPARR